MLGRRVKPTISSAEVITMSSIRSVPIVATATPPLTPYLKVRRANWATSLTILTGDRVVKANARILHHK